MAVGATRRVGADDHGGPSSNALRAGKRRAESPRPAEKAESHFDCRSAPFGLCPDIRRGILLYFLETHLKNLCIQTRGFVVY